MNSVDLLSNYTPEQLAAIEVQIKQQRARERFDKRHGEGAYARLRTLANQGESLRKIGEVFNLTGERIGVLWHDMTGIRYGEWLREQGFENTRARRRPGKS